MLNTACRIYSVQARLANTEEDENSTQVNANRDTQIKADQMLMRRLGRKYMTHMNASRNKIVKEIEEDVQESFGSCKASKITKTIQ